MLRGKCATENVASCDGCLFVLPCRLLDASILVSRACCSEIGECMSIRAEVKMSKSAPVGRAVCNSSVSSESKRNYV